MSTDSNLNLARKYLSLLERDMRAPELRALFTPDFVHREYPNRLNPSGRSLDREQMLRVSERAAEILIEQTYTIRQAVVSGDEVALEVDWTGRFNLPFGDTPAGQPLRAAFGMFLSMRDGRIASQRNYDCFEPF